MVIPIPSWPGCSVALWCGAPAGSHHALQFWVFNYVASVRGSGGFFRVWDRGCRPLRALLLRIPKAEAGAEAVPEIKLVVFGVSLIFGMGAGFGGILTQSVKPQRCFVTLRGWAETYLRGHPDAVGKEVLFCVDFGGIGAISKSKPAQRHLQVLFASCRAVANDPKASSEPQDSILSCRLLPTSASARCRPGTSSRAEVERAEGWWHSLVPREGSGFRRSSTSAFKERFCCIHGKEKLWDRNWSLHGA